MNRRLGKEEYILSIESSCDDTGASVFNGDQMLSNIVASQQVHRDYGGVVPELASRAHQSHIVPVVSRALSQAGVEAGQLKAIGFTRGPGLMGSLVVGVSFAKAMALALGIPLIEVHHMHAHLLSNLIEAPRPTFPFLCLTVSGGHTDLSLVRDPLHYERIGKTIDDAAGEAFDKAGKMLGLPYPAGPEIDRLAADGRPVFEFPKPEIDGLDFSFSGLKTAIRYFLRDRVDKDPEFIENNLPDICASVQERIVTILMDKLEMAARQTGMREICIAGGVSANRGLRRALSSSARKHNWRTFSPAMQFCTDNAAMIGLTAYYKYSREIFSDQTVSPSSRLK